MNNALISEGIRRNLIKFDGEDNSQIIYIHHNKKRNFKNPEEQVQAEIYCQLILEYLCPEKRIRIYETLTMGSTSKEADIIVYADDDCKKPYLVVECKKEDITDAEFTQAVEQAFSYAAVSFGTEFIWVTNKIKNQYFEFLKDAPRERIKNIISDIPKYGTNIIPPYKYVKKPTDGKFKDIQKVTENDLTRRFKQAHDALWAGGELDPSAAFDELDKLIFCKYWDERNTFKNNPYQFQIFKQEPPEILKSRIEALYEQGKKKDPEVFNKNIELSPIKLQTVVSYLQDINLSETDLDSKGKAFETFLDSYFRGDFGQFFTPRNVVQMIVDAVPFDNHSRVLDTSCGSGGFLLYALDRVRKIADQKYDLDDARDINDHFRFWHDFAEKNLFGIEINEQISRVAKMNMILHDDGHTNVISSDGLIPIDEITAKNRQFTANSFDFILTNPPFGSDVKVSEKAFMSNEPFYYDLAIDTPHWIDAIAKTGKGKKSTHKARPSQSTEILFIEQCCKFLKPDGWLAIVLPDGVLTNSSLQYVRDWIEDHFRIVAVVSLPQTAFTHTGAGVKSSVLFLRKHPDEMVAKLTEIMERIRNRVANEMKTIDVFPKLKGNEKKDFKEDAEANYTKARQKEIKELNLDYPIFMAVAEFIGYDATGKTIPQNDLKDITQELNRFLLAVTHGTDVFFQ